LGKLNKDKIIDIIVANSGTDNIGVFLRNRNGTFKNTITHPTGSHSRPRFVAIHDFNKDNISDMIVANSANDNILVLKGHGNE